MALDRAPAGPRRAASVVSRDGSLSEDGFTFLEEMWRQVVAGFVVVPCTATTASNVITLRATLHREGAATYANHMVFAFVADATTSGAVTAKVTDGSKDLTTLKVYINGGATQAGSGDIVTGRLYFASYNAALDAAAGGLVLLNGWPATSAAVASMLGSLLTTRGDLIRRGATAVERFAALTANTFVGGDGTDVTTRTVAQVLTSLGIAVSTYTPTLTTTTNLDAGTANTTYYLNIANLAVLVWGVVGWDATLAASTLTVGGMSLPVASALTAQPQLGGVAADAALNNVARITADATNDRATFTWPSLATVNNNFGFIFAYPIL